MIISKSKILLYIFQFDRNVVTHYYNQEQIFDDIFKHLAIDTENSVNHPIVLTECIANPNYCRQRNLILFCFLFLKISLKWM